ncbi:Hypothetical_protein [Hexamita inflata]|uniref:Hypothetical_protein n=1 Tax=Hexamita inflata TaxID=28002 RepID=A0ABP1J0B8_9EUKA
MSATFIAALTFPKTLVSLIPTYLAQHQPITAAILISLSSQLTFEIDIKQIFKLRNQPRTQFDDKYPIVPKFENEPFPETEQFIFTLFNEIFPPIFPNKPDQFTIESEYNVNSITHRLLIEINDELDKPTIKPEQLIQFVVCFKYALKAEFTKIREEELIYEIIPPY